jgi:asparagine synthase (glutamine-hydrolysing)
MCGIAGIARLGTDAPPSEAVGRAMCATIAHRGPDDEGVKVLDGVVLGMRRLAIIDLSGGQQPIHNEDESVWVVFNGEIYNFRELRAELIQRGHVFTTATDTECIVHAYEEYGLDFANRLDGMFAFALLDRRERRLVLARDHLGIKPLFYSLAADTFVFGSEIKALLASGHVDRRLCPNGLQEFLTWEYVPGSGTLFRDIHKLEPAHMLVVDLTGARAPETRRFWDIAPAEGGVERSDDEWLERLDAVIARNVHAQLVSDVPLGAFLSGGVDSSVVVAAMPNAKTFSIGFDDPSYNELPFAAEVAEHLRVDHRTRTLESRVVEHFDHLMHFMDDPIGDFSIFPTYLVSKLAREHVTVALSGDGGDELFGGYETYVADAMAASYGRLPRLARTGLIEPIVNRFRPRETKKGFVNKAKRFVEGFEFPASLGHARWRAFLSDSERTALLTPELRARADREPWQHIVALRARAQQLDAVDRSLYVDTKSYLVDNCLVKTDRMSMAVSLEVRVPLLGKEVVELAFSLPSRLKVAHGSTKILLKRLAARRVPKQCVYRTKQGFSIPIKTWLGTQFRGVMETYLDARRVRESGLFDAATVERLKREHLAGEANHSHILWSLIVFEKWRSTWLEASHG